MGVKITIFIFSRSFLKRNTTIHSKLLKKTNKINMKPLQWRDEFCNFEKNLEKILKVQIFNSLSQRSRQIFLSIFYLIMVATAINFITGVNRVYAIIFSEITSVSL